MRPDNAPIKETSCQSFQVSNGLVNVDHAFVANRFLTHLLFSSRLNDIGDMIAI